MAERDEGGTLDISNLTVEQFLSLSPDVQLVIQQRLLGNYYTAMTIVRTLNYPLLETLLSNALKLYDDAKLSDEDLRAMGMDTDNVPGGPDAPSRILHACIPSAKRFAKECRELAVLIYNKPEGEAS